MATRESMQQAQAVRQLAVLLCVELRNFTHLSDVLEAEVALGLTSEFFTLAAGAVAQHGGRVITLQNDALLSVFAGERPAHSALQALAAAGAIQRDFDPVGERWRSGYGLPAALAIGVHLGEVVLGMAGPRGAERPVAFGDAVSIAERLVHRARAGEMVLSAVLMKLLGGAGHALGAQPLPALELARRPAVPIFGVLRDTRLDFT
jgi:class 3 adenylate cyclase